MYAICVWLAVSGVFVIFGFVFAAIFAVIGLPVLAGQNSAWIVFTILGGMFWAVALMVVYTGIERKYRIY